MVKINNYLSSKEAACALTKAVLEQIEHSGNKIFHIALSGGNTPATLFRLWAEDFRDIIPWKKLQIYWVDERCVPSDHPDSNFGMTKKILLDKVPLSEMQIHRIHGEEDPQNEAKRYSALVERLLPEKNTFPVFDSVLLGIGIDGHTSSLFPGQNSLIISPDTYIVNEEPGSGRHRIALTGLPILHARSVFFFVTGEDKKEILRKAIKGDDSCPAGYIIARLEEAELFTDSI